MVYFITDGSGYVKIGVAKNVKDRMMELQIGNPRTLKCLKTIEVREKGYTDYDLEHCLHLCFAKYAAPIDNCEKTEWFDLHAVEPLLSLSLSGIEKVIKKNFGYTVKGSIKEKISFDRTKGQLTKLQNKYDKLKCEYDELHKKVGDYDWWVLECQRLSVLLMEKYEMTKEIEEDQIKRD